MQLRSDMDKNKERKFQNDCKYPPNNSSNGSSVMFFSNSLQQILFSQIAYSSALHLLPLITAFEKAVYTGFERWGFFHLSCHSDKYLLKKKKN